MPWHADCVLQVTMAIIIEDFMWNANANSFVTTQIIIDTTDIMKNLTLKTFL